MFFLIFAGAIDVFKYAIAPVEHQFRVLAMLGIEKPLRDLELWPSADDEEAVRRLLEGEWVGENQVLVGINPGASPKWATKKWSPENFAKVCDALALEEIRTVLVGSKAEAETGIEILKLTKSKPINLISKTSLTELAALMKRFKCLITSDSAPMHIAAAMKTPFVALFGPTAPMRHLPPAGKYVVITKDLRCAPCYKPICSDTRCMREITVAEVLKAVKDVK